MYFRIQSRKNQFKHSSNSKLIMGVAIGQRRAILFYSNGKFFDYDLYQKKILYSSNLGEKPFRGVSVNPSQIICMLSQSRKIISINIKKKEINEICRIPLTSTHDDIKDHNIFFLSEIRVFKATHSFYLEENNQEENRKKIIYFPDTNNYKENYLIKEYESAGLNFEPVDQNSRIAIYKQRPEPDRKWELRLVNLAADFDQRKYILEHKAFGPASIIEQVWAKTEQELLIFINGATPEILLLDLEKSELIEFPIKLGFNFRNVIFYNAESQVACLTYLANTRINGQLFENILELVDLQKATVIERAYATLKDLSSGWENDYLLDIAAQNKTGNVSIFHTRHFIKKRSLYFNLLIKAGVIEKYGQGVSREVLDRFE